MAWELSPYFCILYTRKRYAQRTFPTETLNANHVNQKRLYNTIAGFASRPFRSERDLLKHVVNEIVRNDEIAIKGGRIWQYASQNESFRLIHQTGVIERLESGYEIPVSRYPVALEVTERRSVVAKESDRYLRKMGIVVYSATGVGEKIRYGDKFLYQYVLAFNSETMDETLVPELNIISVAVTSLLSRQKMERKATLLAQDIDKAREIQLSILPEPALRFSHYDIYGMSIPERIVGGDFFDYFFTDEDKDRLSIIIGDAASKGLKAAAQAMYVVGGFRMGISYHTKISSLIDRTNRLIHQAFSDEQFVSMFYAEFLDDPKGLILYANAGHNPPLIYHVAENRVELLQPTGQILGPFPEEKIKVEHTYMHPGDVAVMYTDGISEAAGPDEEFYGEQSIARVMTELHARSAEEICKGILEDCRRFGRGSEEGDDKTVVVVKRST